MYHSIKPGKVWLDTNGNPIHTHVFSAFYNEKEKLWYRKFPNCGSGWGVLLD